MTLKDPWLVLTVGPDEPQARLDAWLAVRVQGLSRRQAQQLIAEGAVTVDGRVARKGDLPGASSEVALWSAPKLKSWQPQPDTGVPLDVVYEDEHLVAVAKPSGFPSVPLHPREPGTLAGAVVARYSECAALGRSSGDGGLLHRLDRETSGVVLVARNQTIYDQLWAVQRAEGMEKRYMALVSGEVEARHRVIATGLRQTGQGRVRVETFEDTPVYETRVAPVSAHGPWQLVEARIHRGFMHQIRVHLASVGLPIAGDALYGAGAPTGLTRLFLHACEMRFEHPATGEALSLNAPLPGELAAILESI